MRQERSEGCAGELKPTGAYQKFGAGPNTYTCSKCCHNAATKGLTRPMTPEQYKVIAERSYCQLRQIDVPDPYGICCGNWLPWTHPDPASDERFHVVDGRAYDRDGQVVHSPEGYTDEDERRDR